MKIAFLTNCLKPGRDGVGDYTTLLAGECERLGHETRSVSLNDPLADSAKSDPGQLRLPASLPWTERVSRAREFLAAFQPDMVSLQFVPYGFHPRGIDFRMGARFREIIGGTPVQIMFHELWIGATNGTPLKERITGALQRACIAGILKKLNVRAVHTSNASYAALLGARGILATVLPLFGAIPFPSTAYALRARGETLAFGMFGSLHPVWSPEPLFSLLLKAGKKIEVMHIGGMGAGGALWKKMEHDYTGRIAFKMLGRQPAERIAEFFRDEIDFGIATTPWELAGKSATVAAMLEHGLPVIVNRDDWHIDNSTKTEGASPLLIKMDGSLPEKISAARREPPRPMLPVVASQFLGDLELMS